MYSTASACELAAEKAFLICQTVASVSNKNTVLRYACFTHNYVTLVPTSCRNMLAPLQVASYFCTAAPNKIEIVAKLQHLELIVSADCEQREHGLYVSRK